MAFGFRRGEADEKSTTCRSRIVSVFPQVGIRESVWLGTCGNNYSLGTANDEKRDRFSLREHDNCGMNR